MSLQRKFIGTRRMVPVLLAALMCFLLAIPAYAQATTPEILMNVSVTIDNATAAALDTLIMEYNDEDEMPPGEAVTRDDLPRPAWTVDMLSDRPRTGRTGGVSVHGVVPYVLPSFGTGYDTVNAYIEEAVAALIQDAQRIRARSITFDYAVYDTESMVSVVIFATIASVTARESVLSVNFDPHTGQRMTLHDALGFDVTPLVTQLLEAMTRRNPERDYAARSASPQGQGFYITDLRLVLLYDEFQLSSVAGGVGRLPLVLANIQRPEPLTPDQHRPLGEGYNLRMVQIGDIARALGYDTHSDVNEYGVRYAEIWRDDVFIRFTEGVNNYVVDGIMERALESAPLFVPEAEGYLGRFLVPITFVEQILSLTTYSVCAAGYITFLAYRT